MQTHFRGLLLSFVVLLPACGGERAEQPGAPTESASPTGQTAAPASMPAAGTPRSLAPGPTAGQLPATQAELSEAMAEAGRALGQAAGEALAGAATQAGEAQGPEVTEDLAASAEAMGEAVGQAMGEGLEQMGEAMAEGMAQTMEVMGEMMMVMVELGPQLQAIDEQHDLDTSEGMRAAADDLDAAAGAIRERAESTRPEVRQMLEEMAVEMEQIADLAREDPEAAVRLRAEKQAAGRASPPGGAPPSPPLHAGD